MPVTELVHADDRRFARFDAQLMFVRATGDLVLKKADADRFRGSTKRIDALDQFERTLFNFVGQLLDVPAAGQWIDGLCNSRLEADDLLSAESECRGGCRR